MGAFYVSLRLRGCRRGENIAMRRVGAFLSAVLVSYVLAAIAATQSVLARLPEMGVPVTFAQRISVTAHDLTGMASSYLPLIAVALLIAFLVTALVGKYLSVSRTALYMLAGGVAVVCIHLGLEAAFGIAPVAATRTVLGLLVQGLAGAVGGYAFARISSKPALF